MPDARRATYRRSSILMTMCTARRPPIDKPVSQRLTFPRSSRSFARQLIYRRALELYAAARRRAAFTDDIVCPFCLLEGVSTPATPIVFASNREYRIDMRNDAMDSIPARPFVVSFYRGRNYFVEECVPRLQKSIAIRSKIRRLARMTDSPSLDCTKIRRVV